MKRYNKNNVQIAKTLRKNLTPQERKLWYEFLRNFSPRFQRQKPIGEYVVDFYCAKAQLAVELDGSGHYEEQQEKKDEKRTFDLHMMNIEVVRFCNLDVDRNFTGVCLRIEEIVAERLGKEYNNFNQSEDD